jgi:hypothetical protein
MSPTFSQATARLTVEALAGVVSAALHQQQQHGPNHNMPSPDGQASEMAGYELCCGQGWVGRVWHPLDLPEGLPHGSPGAEPDDAPTGSGKGCPRAAVWLGWRQVDEMPHSPSAQDHRRPAAPESLVAKHLIENQMFGSRQIASQMPHRRASRSTSVGTSTATDDHGHPRT